MFDAILNAIAERSQALRDKDAEIATWEETATEQEARINGLIEDCAFRDDRIKELTESHRQVYDTGHEATQRAETAESQLMQIAEALDIEHVIQAGLTPEAEAVEEVAEVEAILRSDMGGVDKLREVIKADYEIAPAEEPDAEKEAEEPATEG